jgi:hypothetical protein
MIAPDREATACAPDSSLAAAALGPGAMLRRHRLPTGESLELARVPADEPAEAAPLLSGGASGEPATTARDWVAAAAPAPAVTVVPLYDCHVVWSPVRAAVVGPADRLDHLETATVEFAGCEAQLRDAEARATALLETAETDAADSLDLDAASADRRRTLAGRYREAVAVGRRLALLAPAIHAPPLHPPTLASQLGERLRDRTRLAERHALAVERAELAERVAEASSQRAIDLGIARRQTALEWAIVVLLVVQTALLVVDLLSRQGAS